MITTIQNKQIKQIMKLKKNARERRKQQLFLVEGIRMFTEIPEQYLYKVYASEDFYKEHQAVFEGMEVELVSDQVMKEISDTMTPQGVLALVRMLEYSLEDLLQQENPLLLVLENLQDPGNLGTILRTGEGAGINGIIMSRETVDIYNPKVTRSTMGSIFRVPFVYVDDLFEVIKMMKDRNITTYAAHLNGTDYTRESYTSGTAFLIGNEGNGLTDELTDNAQKKIKIPMCGRVESLNAAMASGLLVYEARRQRQGVDQMYAVYWLIASAVFLLIEILTLGLTSIWFAGGAVVAAIAALFGVPFLVQMLLFIVVTCLLFALTRPVAKRYLNNRVQKTNTDALIGQTALVKETINNMESKGYVQLNGQDWTARSAEAGEIIPAGCEVVVKEIQGVKLIVEREV